MATPKEKVLFTGFPGFIGRRLVKRILETASNTRFTLLVHESLAERAAADRNDLLRAFALPPERLEIVQGDITRENLGLAGAALEGVLEETTRVFHLAALYDLATPREPAFRVNVRGTENVLDLCERARKHPRLVYFSTCYVSGDREGTVLEEDLERGQGFKNFYEETKYLAEVEVRKRLDRVPTVVIRPAIVVGDSRTGETAKYDGPYFMMRFYTRKPSWLPGLLIGEMRTPTNVVPVDFVIEAVTALASMPEALGKTFHLADPRPLTSREYSDRICDYLEIPRATRSLPEGVVLALAGIRPIERWAGIPRQVIPFLNHHATYDTTNTRALLDPRGVSCPYLDDYFPTLFKFLVEHPDL